MKNLFKNKLTIILIAVFAFTTFLRFYQLGNIPAGFLNDEANAGYDAYSLLKTGHDQWNNFLPISNFIGFGDFQPPVFRYTSIIPIALFGLSEFSIRFMSALAGVLSVIVLFFLVKKLVNSKAALLSAVLLAIMPWAFGLNRIGHESNIAVLFLILALFFGFIQKSRKDLLISSFFLAACMYTYSAYILYAPITLFLILYANYKKELGFKPLFYVLIFFLILISPIIFQKNSASVRFSQVGITTNINSIGLINTLNDERGQCLAIVNPNICKIADNKIALFISIFVKNYLSHFSPNFLYINGTATQFSILPLRGLDYLFCFPLLILGIVFLLRQEKQRKLNIIFILLFLLSALPDSLTSDGNYTRASIMIPYLAILNGIGAFFLFDVLNKQKFGRLFSLAFILVILFSFTSFYILYNSYFKNNYSIFSQYGYRELMQKTYSVETGYDRIYISRHLNDAKQYIYYLFYKKYDPSSFQKKEGVDYKTGEDGWISIDRINNIYFVDNPPTASQLKKLSNQKVLIVSNPVDFPKIITPVFVVKDKLGNTIFKAVNSTDLLEYENSQKMLELMLK